MEELDGDTVRLSSRGRYAERDIVQVRYFSTECMFYKKGSFDYLAGHVTDLSHSNHYLHRNSRSFIIINAKPLSA